MRCGAGAFAGAPFLPEHEPGVAATASGSAAAVGVRGALVAAGVSVVEIGSQRAQQAADGAAASPVAATGAVHAGGEEAR